MVTVSLIITQSGTPGSPGVSRDDIVLSTPVVLSNDNDTDVTVWSWRLLARPSNSGAVLSTTDTPTTQFTPDQYGSYLVELRVNGRVRGRIIAAVLTAAPRNWRIPARGEGEEFEGGWWAAMEHLLIDASNNIGGGGGGGQTNTVTGSSGITNVGNNVNANLAPTYGSSASTICQGNDSRLSDARTPTGHNTSHQSGGGDAIKLDDLASPDDNTDLDATTGAHGLLPKLGGGTTNYLRADGSWAAPPGGGGGNTLDQAYDEGGSGAGRVITVDSGPVYLDAGEGSSARLDGYLELEEIATPAQLVFRGLVYGKRVSGDSEQTELHYLDNNGNEVQITDDGSVAGGGGGVLDRDLIFSDDTQFAESGSSYVTKKTFRVVRDSAKSPSSWRLVVSLWIAGGGTSADCRLQAVGSGGTDQATVSSTEVTETYASIKKIALTITANEPVDEFITINIQLQATGGGTAYLQYTDLYAIYT